MDEEKEYEWECSVCGCADLEITDQVYNGVTVYKCPDCNNKQDLSCLLKRIEGLKEDSDALQENTIKLEERIADLEQNEKRLKEIIQDHINANRENIQKVKELEAQLKERYQKWDELSTWRRREGFYSHSQDVFNWMAKETDFIIKLAIKYPDKQEQEYEPDNWDDIQNAQLNSPIEEKEEVR